MGVPQRLGCVSRVCVFQSIGDGLTMFVDLVWDDIGFTSSR